MYVRHIVMWKLKSADSEEAKQEMIDEVIDALLSCADCVEGILEFEVGQATPGLEATYDVVLNSLFESQEDLDAYQVHPKHEAIKGLIGALRESRQCMDYYVEE